MLSLLLLFFLLRGIGTLAVPIIDRGEPLSSAPAAELQRRTMFNIVWGCLSTTFICAWVSVHPNIPPPKSEECGWRSLARRMWLMFWTLVAPELILLWSCRQWVAAGKIAKIYNERNKSRQAPVLKPSFFVTLGKSITDWCTGRLDEKERKRTAWTRTHGHFVAMGGIILQQSGRHVRLKRPTETIVDIAMFEMLVRDRNFILDIAEEELNDKAKGDLLSKIIAFLQVSWFITQCIARFVQGLDITELEIVTLALASMNGIMYFFWSSKPLGLQVPIRIIDRSTWGVFQQRGHDGRALRTLPTLDESLLYTPIWAIVLCWLLSPLAAIAYLLLLLIAALGDVMMTDAIPPNATHVPAFYSPLPKRGSSDFKFRLIFSFVGSLFGGLHCLAWNFTYPTQAERTIWRVASVIITLTPPAFVVFLQILATLARAKVNPYPITEGVLPATMGLVMEHKPAVITLLPAGIYVLARLVLLVEAFALLRAQPPSVFQAIVWTDFLPHL